MRILKLVICIVFVGFLVFTSIQANHAAAPVQQDKVELCPYCGTDSSTHELETYPTRDGEFETCSILTSEFWLHSGIKGKFRTDAEIEAASHEDEKPSEPEKETPPTSGTLTLPQPEKDSDGSGTLSSSTLDYMSSLSFQKVHCSFCEKEVVEYGHFITVPIDDGVSFKTCVIQFGRALATLAKGQIEVERK